MSYEKEKKPSSIFDYVPVAPIDPDNDLVKIFLSNSDVLYGRRDESTSHWLLDPDLTPPKISLIGIELEARAFRIKVCSIGEPVFIKAIGLPDHLFCCLTRKGTVVRLQTVQRSNRLKPSTLDYTSSSR